MDCAELLHEWNSKLQDIGFFDIEMKSESRATIRFIDDVESRDDVRGEYYSKLYEKTNEEKFQNKTHEFILRKKAEGAKIVDIVRELDSKGRPIHRETVRHVIRRFENKWQIRRWTNKDMNLKDPTG